jgi:hypothetical protein
MSEVLENLKKRLAAKRPKSPVAVMKTHRAKMVEVSVGELKAAIEARSNHPNAEAFAIGIRLGEEDEMPDQAKLTVEAIDLQALLDGSETETVEVVEDGIPYLDKKIKKGPVVADPGAKPPKPKKPKED